MKIILSIVFGTFLITSCNNKQPEVKVEHQEMVEKQDNPSKDSVRERAYIIDYNPFKDINNFEINFGDRFIDSLHASYTTQEQVKATFTKDICIGDNCESYKTIVNTQKNTILYLFKGDGGEYGFSNDQYLLHKDSLIYVRNFSVGIESWPTDSTGTLWKIEEKIYHFQGSSSYIKTRTAITKNLDQFDFTLQRVKQEIAYDFEKEKLYNEQSLELQKLLEMKDSENRE